MLLGYTKIFYLNNFANFLIYVLLKVCVAFFICATKSAKQKKIIQLRKWFVESMVWSSPLEFLLQTFVFQAISCYIQFDYSHAHTTHAAQFSFFVGCISMLVIVVAPFASLWLLWRNKTNLKSKAFFDKFNVLYEGLNVDR